MEEPVVILDNGSGYIKAGFSHQRVPQITMPTLVGRQTLTETILDSSQDGLKSIMYGDEVVPYRSLLDLSYPIRAGQIQDKEGMEELWKYCFTKKLGITDATNRKILVTEAPNNPLINKKIICDLLFDFGFEKLNIEPQAKLSLFSEGMDTGLVLDSGDGVSHCIPILNGAIQHYHIKKMDVAGRNITECLIKLLLRKGYAFNSSADFEMVREIKEKFCFVSCDLRSDRKLNKETSFFNSFYLLPDGNRIQISDEKYEAPELLFQPAIDIPGIHQMVFNSIHDCDIDNRKPLYEHIVLSGASTLFPGFATRIENEVKALYVAQALKEADSKRIKININVIDSPRRKHSVFIGAAIIAQYYNNSNEESNNYWITKEEWENSDNQDSILKQKCLNMFVENYISNKN